jgi:uncharacterized protein
MTERDESALARLFDVLLGSAPAAVALSGGVDSMTLAAAAHAALGDRVEMFHAVSPAVPPAATARVRAHAAHRGWRLSVIEAGEFADPRYVANPADRCFFCKQNLYGAIAAHTSAQILSGTNLDDLGDWRPGLRAADAQGVRHPFVEAAIDKATVRTLARQLELGEVAELPAAPCLSSRIETGIAVAAPLLRLVDDTERLIHRRLTPSTVRCRVRRSGLVIELDGATHARIDAARRAALAAEIGQLAAAAGLTGAVDFAPYRQGSAFLRDGA